MLDEYQRDEALIHFQRGQVLERAHRVQEAVEEYRRAIVHDPTLREAHGALGFYYQRHGLLAKAAEEFRVVASLEDDFLTCFNLGYVLMELGRYDQALDAFQRCRSLAPDDPATRYELGLLSFLRGDYQNALAELQAPLEHYPDDWDIHSLVGRCQLKLGNYDQALAAFGNALRAAPRPEAQAEAIRGIQMVDRWREIEPPGSLKDRLYAEHGVVYLGSAQDDGLRCGDMHDYHFTYPDIGTTLQRFLAVAHACEWSFTAIVGLDRVAQPLATAFSRLLDVPLLSVDEAQPGGQPLLVQAVGREAELVELAVERNPGEPITFCLGMNWLRHRQVYPDITGVIARNACSVPWEPELRRLRSDGAPRERIAACLSAGAEQIVAATYATPPDQNLDQQIAYYQRHERLRFSPAPIPV